MFSGNLRYVESEQTKITLHDIDSNILEQILNYIYTAELEVINNLVVIIEFCFNQYSTYIFGCHSKYR